MFAKAPRVSARSQTERMWMLGGGLVAFILLLIGYFFFISPQRSDTASLESQNESAQSQNAVLHQRINSLREQSKQLPRFQADLAAAQKALPTTSGISDFLRTLQSLGNATLAEVSSVSVGAPTDVTGVSTGSGSTASGSAGSDSAAPDSAAPSSAAPSSAPGSAAGSPAPGSTGTAPAGSVFGLAITAQVSGSPTALNRFLAQLQSVQPRAVLITQITESTGTAGKSSAGSTMLQLTMQAFVAPSSQAEKSDLAAASDR